MTDTIPPRSPELEGLRYRLTHAPDWRATLNAMAGLTARECTELTDRRMPFRAPFDGTERRARRGVFSR